MNFPTKGGEIEFKFDEYVVLKDPTKNIYLSPPQKKRVNTRIRGKSIIVSFPQILDSSITYALHFRNSITDNNEGNLFYPYVFSFSTGKSIDSMLFAGVILDATTLLPLEDIAVGFYSDLSDTAVYKTFPAAIAKSDKWGYFVVRNLKPIPYRVFAFADGNNNNMYDPENEMVAFNDSLIIPSKTMRKDIEELKYVDMKDTSRALARPSQMNLYLFKEDSQKQFLKNKARPERKMVYLTFNAPNVILDSIVFRNIDSSKIIKQFNIKRDSLIMWVADTLMNVPDTLFLDIKYLKSDSLNNLVSTKENLKLIAPKPKKEENSKKYIPNSSEKRIRADLLKLTIEADPAKVEQQGIRLIFPSPLARLSLDSVLLLYKTPKGVKGNEGYTFSQDTLENRLYYIKPNGRLLMGYEYSLKIPERVFKDIYGFTNDSSITSFVLPNTEKLSKLTLNVEGADGSYVIELTDQTRKKVFRSFKISKDTKLEFPYIQPGKYNIRITQDLNGNGILDTGNLLLKKQPEKVRLYMMQNGTSVFDFKEGLEIEQNINLNKLFK